jgi:8-oxo-dGTP diphosphatase
MRHVTSGCVLVKDAQILLTLRSEGLLEAGKWCLPGGYMDRDETIAQGITREVMEETGWEVRDLQLLRVNDNPDRPHEDRQNIDFVYVGVAGKKTGEKDWESSEVRWFPLDKLPPAGEIAFDHGSNIELYKKYLKEPFTLPVLG